MTGVTEYVADETAVDAVLTASRALVAVATDRSGAAAEDITIAQYRALVVLASRGPERMVDLAGALDVTPSTAGRMCDRLVRKGLVRRHRARADRRVVQVSITPAGRQVVDQATARRRALLAAILAKLRPSSSCRWPLRCRRSPPPPGRSPTASGRKVRPVACRRLGGDEARASSRPQRGGASMTAKAVAVTRPGAGVGRGRADGCGARGVGCSR